LDKRGQVVPKEDLIQQIWPDTFVTEANLTQNISSLRKALGERPTDPRYVVTVPVLVYSFVGDVLEVPREATAEMRMPVFPPPPAASGASPATGEILVHVPVSPAPPDSLPDAELIPATPSLLDDTLSAPFLTMVPMTPPALPAPPAVSAVSATSTSPTSISSWVRAASQPIAVTSAWRWRRPAPAVLPLALLVL